MKLSPKLIGPAIGMITGVVTSTVMSFIGLALNYGFHPDFLVRWAKAASTRYVIGVPLVMLVLPVIERAVLRQAGLAPKRA